MKSLLIVGGGIAGASCAYSSRINGWDVTLVSAENEIGYFRCGLPYLIGGKVKSLKDLMYIPKDKLTSAGVNVITGNEVIDLKDGKAYLSSGKKVNFDKVILAVGAKPNIPEIPGKSLDGVIYLRSATDALKIMERIKKSKNVVVIGANATGVEVSEALINRGVNVYLIDIADFILWRLLDKDMARILTRYLIKIRGLNLLLSSDVKEIKGRTEVSKVVLNNSEIDTKLVILATGALPNTELGKKVGLKIGKKGGIIVDEYLRASENTFAVGDCIEVKNILTNENILLQTAPTALRQSRIVIENLESSRVKYKGEIPASMLKTFNLYLGTAGLREEEARRHFKIFSIKGRYTICPSYYNNGCGWLEIKMLADEKKLQPLGIQIIGNDPQAVSQRVNWFASLLQLGASLEEIANISTSYSPPMALPNEPISDMAQKILKNI